MTNSCVQQIDLGLRICGVDQCEYSVNGVRGKTIGQAVGLASINRAASIEQVIDAYMVVIERHNAKISELSDMLAVLADARAKYDGDDPKSRSYTEAKYEMDYGYTSFNSDSDFIAALDKYGISHSWNGGKISAADVDKIQADVSYAADNADTDLQTDVATMQSYVTKRDDAYSTAGQLQSKCDDSISNQMKYMGA